MGRPTDEKKDRVVKLRISEDLYRELESKGDNLSATIRNLIKNGGRSYVPQKNDKCIEELEIKKLNDELIKKTESVDFVPQNTEDRLQKWGIKEEWLEDLSTMQSFMGGSVGEMIRLFDEAVNDGVLNYENGKFVGVPDLNLDYFKDACHLINKEPQEMLDKVTTMIEKGRI